MKILVLGGTGAMGIDLVKILAERGDQVVITSRFARRFAHRSDRDNIEFIQGNAHDITFIKGLLSEKFDAIVDFMVYRTDEFRNRLDILLNSADQYVFLSSGRVYADSKTPICEDSPRLLDVSNDKTYLETDEYALKKARQEDLLHETGKTNWTIIRPYITYSDQRLQLGVYEKELWLYRALRGRTILFPQALTDKFTTMTLGEDVSKGISVLIGNKKAMGQVFHITCDKSIRWSEVIEIYQRVFRSVMGYEFKLLYLDDMKQFCNIIENNYQLVYDRIYNRKFNNEKFVQTTGVNEFTTPDVGLERCLRQFLAQPTFKEFSVKPHARMDRISHERTKLAEIPGTKQIAKYMIVRYFPEAIYKDLRTLGRK